MKGGAAQKKSMGEAGGGVCGAMVESSQRQSFESLGGTKHCSWKFDEFERVCHLEND